MALSQTSLRSAIEGVFNDARNGLITKEVVAPKLHSSVASALADAYDNYAKSALAGTLTASSTDKGSLASALEQEKFGGWGEGFANYWKNANFSGAGFIPKNSITPPASLQTSAINSDISSKIIDQETSSTTASSVADELAKILHTATTNMTVSATTTSTPPVTSTLPVK